MTERMLVWGCSLLVLIVIFAGGFYFGQKYARRSDLANQIVQQDAEFPSPEADALLDAAFTSLDQGNYREAMMNFQKAQDVQTTLFGLDYLIAESAYKAGENVLAEEAAGRAVSKSESADRARALIALINLGKTKSPVAETQQLVDPNVAAETQVKQLIAGHLGDAKSYLLWGDLLRSGGSYRSAADVLHKGVLRADPEGAKELLSAKEQLAMQQNKPAKAAPTLSDLTSMNAEQALVSALACLQSHDAEAAGSFLERARDIYSPKVFRELMRDMAFSDYHDDPQIKPFFNKIDH